MSGYAKLLLRGSVQILGTPQKPVAFRNADTSESWNGIHLATGPRYFLIRNVLIEDAFRNTVTQSAGLFENVHFVNNYYGLWVESSPKAELVGCSFKRNRFALSVGTGSVYFKNTEIRDNVFGLYLEKGASFVGDTRPFMITWKPISAVNPMKWRGRAARFPAASGNVSKRASKLCIQRLWSLRVFFPLGIFSLWMNLSVELFEK
jgi:hypothetical protein